MLSRCHGGAENRPEIAPLCDLFNGAPEVMQMRCNGMTRKECGVLNGAPEVRSEKFER